MNTTTPNRNGSVKKASDMVDRLMVIEAMQRYGGGFVSALAVAWAKADTGNHKRLMEAFGDVYDRYAEVALDDARRQGVA